MAKSSGGVWQTFAINDTSSLFVAYRIYGHNASDPVRQRDVQRRRIDWIEQYFAEPALSCK